MPELPEVETTRRGIATVLDSSTIEQFVVRNAALRWPVPVKQLSALKNQTIQAVWRRGKYIGVQFNAGAVLIHLGMSGSLRVVKTDDKPDKHAHIDICICAKDGQRWIVRYHDPRRFGSFVWAPNPPQSHKLLCSLGPEPLTTDFHAGYLFARSRKRKQSIKTFIMDSRVVVGVGNIYASEALFLAKIRPAKAAGRLRRQDNERLVQAIKTVLDNAIEAGGTTLNDFYQSDGQPGYFEQQLNVYGRAGQACRQCQASIKQKILGQRSSYYCPTCQS